MLTPPPGPISLYPHPQNAHLFIHVKKQSTHNFEQKFDRNAY